MKFLAVILCIIMAFASGTFAEDDAEITRDGVPDYLVYPNRIMADSLFYGRLGYGAIIGSDISGHGVAFGLGYRYEMDRFGMDISFGNTIINSSDDNEDIGFDISLIRLGGIWFISPLSDITPYIGSGLSYGTTVASKQGNEDYKWNWGLRGDVSVGIEMMRTGNIRIFIECDLILPFYKTEIPGGDPRYSPLIVFSMGVAW